MRVPRMTTRRWMMFVVAIALLIAGGVRLMKRREDFAVRAIQHAMRILECQNNKFRTEELLDINALLNDQLALARSAGEPDPEWLDKGSMGRTNAVKPQRLEEVARMERAIAYHAAMQRKYEYAAQHPWLPVELDPPEPE